MDHQTEPIRNLKLLGTGSSRQPFFFFFFFHGHFCSPLFNPKMLYVIISIQASNTDNKIFFFFFLNPQIHETGGGGVGVRSSTSLKWQNKMATMYTNVRLFVDLK